MKPTLMKRHSVGVGSHAKANFKHNMLVESKALKVCSATSQTSVAALGIKLGSMTVLDGMAKEH
jgi:hypothetical protein